MTSESKIPVQAARTQEAALSRRELLKYSTLACGGTLFPSGLAWGAAPHVHAPEHKDVIVLGSGFGGAITAYRLAKKGVPSLLIEQGRRWDQDLAPGVQRFSKNFYPDGRSTWLSSKTVLPIGPALPIRKTTGVLQSWKLAGKNVLNGSAYGGGSITSGGILLKPDEKLFSLVFPEEISFQEMVRHYDTVISMLQPSPIPKDVLQADCYRHIRLMQEHCEKAGVEWQDFPTSTDWSIVRDEIAARIPPSLTHGETVYGVNSGAKLTLESSYLKEAEASGYVDVRILHQVQDLGIDEAGNYRLQVDELNEDGKLIGKRTFTCKKLFLAAGSIGTSRLLVKAKAKRTLPRLNEEVGKGWGNNGNAFALRLGLDEATGKWQGGPAAMGVNDRDNPLVPLVMEHAHLALGFEMKALLYFSFGLTPTRGEFHYHEETDKFSLDWPEVDEGQALVNQAMLNTLDKMNQTSGGHTSSLLTLLKDTVKDDVCFHPLGGCVMGKATDFYGRVKGYAGLYVNDGSFMPGSAACTNPALTIAALAERNIERIISEDF